MSEPRPKHMTQNQLYYPGRPIIDAYGNGGFRFADMSHQGSLLFLPNGVFQWQVSQAETLSTRDFAPVYSQVKQIDLLLIGTGDIIMAPPETVRAACEVSGVTVEAMTTGAAVRTYNILIGEQRPVAAALIAVANIRR